MPRWYLTATDKEGRTFVNNTYDSQERVSFRKDAMGQTTSFSYAKTNNGFYQTTVTDRTGHSEIYTFDPNLRLIFETDGAGNTQTWTRDANENVTAYANANDHVTTYTYDSNGNVLTTADAKGGDHSSHVQQSEFPDVDDRSSGKDHHFALRLQQ